MRVNTTTSLPRVAWFLSFLVSTIDAAGYRTVGSSGVAPQMAFLPPFTTKVVFIDKFHPNHGYPSVNLQTGEGNAQTWLYPNTNVPVFGAEYDLNSHALRSLRPEDDTSCSIGAFFSDGTLVNMAGAAAGVAGTGVGEGFNKVRTYAPGPCTNDKCTQNWVERGMLSSYRWYPTAQTSVSGDVFVVGGSRVGQLAVNVASVNVPTYELVSQSDPSPNTPVNMPILDFTAAENEQGGYSYNMYPILHLLPNTANKNYMFTLAGNRSEIWDYGAGVQIKSLPDIPNAARTFPASAASVLLPMAPPFPEPRILVCGGASFDIPYPKGQSDCWTITPLDANAEWTPTDSLPNGPQVLSNSILLPNGNVLILNGARTGCGGSFMAEDPVLTPVVYDPTGPAGKKFTSLPGTSIPRMYHSVAIMTPSGEILVAGSNTAVTYSATGVDDNPTYPNFSNNGVTCFLKQSQSKSSGYPTEYRVEMLSPLYVDAPRPTLVTAPTSVSFNQEFSITATMGGTRLKGTTQVVMTHSGFSTHSQNQGQRMVYLTFKQAASGNGITATAPLNGSVMPPGVYLLWVVSNGAPSTAKWVKLS